MDINYYTNSNLLIFTSKLTYRRFSYLCLSIKYSSYEVFRDVPPMHLLPLFIHSPASLPSTLPTIYQSPLFSLPIGLPFNSFVIFANIFPEPLGSCIKISLKCTRLVNIFSPCLQIYQSAYYTLCISALFIVAEYSLGCFLRIFLTHLQSKH